MSLTDQLFQLIISGISVGAVYAVVGLGFMIVYSVTRVVNFTQGQFVMLGGMLTATFYARGLPLPVAMILSIVVTLIVGLIIQRVVVHPARRASVVTLILLTFGASIVIQGIALLIWGTDPKSFPPFSGTTPIHISSAVIAPQALWVLGVGIVLVILLFAFFEYSFPGKTLRACSINPWAARLMGISPEVMALIAFGLAAVLGAAAGIVLTPWTTSSYGIGTPMAMKGFVAALAGGLDRIDGVLLGGFALAMLEALAAGFLPSGFKDGIALFILLVVLFFRPTGLLGGAEAGKI